MPDPYVPLPEDDESVDALLDDYKEVLRALVPGWEPSDASLEVAVGAGSSEEASTLYSLLRDAATDKFREFGRDVLGIIPGEATPASTTTTWIAGDTLGHTIDAGQPLVVDATPERIAFEVVNQVDIPSGEDTATGVIIQALAPGAAATLADGDVLFDDPPAWIESVTLEEPATGGTDGEEDDVFLARLTAAAQLLTRTPILPHDFELTVQEIPEIARALVLNLYDVTTDTDNVPRAVSIFPVNILGAAVSAGAKADAVALVASRREVNFLPRVADATYTTVNVVITVAAKPGAVHADVAIAAEAALRDQALNPALFGQPPLGQRRSWQLRKKVRLYEVSTVASEVEEVDYVDSLTLNGAAADVTLTGRAPLPVAGTIAVTVIDPA